MSKDKKARKVPTVKKSSKSEHRGVRISEIPGEVKLERSPFKLSGRIQYLSTDIDALRNYVIEKKRVKLSEAAAKFNVSKNIIEDWGSILEDHHILDMHYPVAGEPTLKVHEHKKSWKEKKAEREKLKQLKREDKEALKTGKIPKGSSTESGEQGHKSWKPKFTKKRIFIMAEIIILAEVLIYIFAVNPHLRDNFLPTLNYQIANLPQNLIGLPQHISNIISSLFGRQMLINPIYFVIGLLFVVFWIAVVLIQKRKKSAFTRDWKKRHEKDHKAKK